MDVQLQSWDDMELARVPQYLPGQHLSWLLDARQSAYARYAAHGLPTRREEEWKYTDVSAIGKRASLAPDNIPPDPASEASLFAWTLAQEAVHLLVFVNGHYASELSAAGQLPAGVQLHSLAQLLEQGGEVAHSYFEAQQEHTIFAALNNALFTDGAVLTLSAGSVLEKPLYLLYIASGHAAAIYPRNLVIAGEGARATLIEHYFGMLDVHNFTNALTQLSLGEQAELQHYKLMQEGKGALHVAGIHAEQAAASQFISHSFALGGRLCRNDISTQLRGADARCALHGLYLLDGRQHTDHHTRIDHLAPSCSSREYYRGILQGAAHGVFNGKVIVHPGAIKTDAHQVNHNLLLSPQAEVDTKPQLEIFADEVKCTHGATVGQLDEDSLFYLRSRGIDALTAHALLVYGFAHDIIARVGLPSLRERIEHLVLDRLQQGEQIRELL